MTSISENEGTSSTSTVSKSCAIATATLRRRRSACTKSTAEMKRDWRNVLGQAPAVFTATGTIGPSVLHDRHKPVAPPRVTGLNVGTLPRPPLRVVREPLLTRVTEPIAVPSRLAAVAAPRTALVPDDPSSRFHG